MTGVYDGPRLVGSLRARPTVYKGVHMRSRLEASFAAILDNEGSQWRYEPECFADETGQYLPDFVRWELDEQSTETYVEVKPSARLGPATDQVQRRMEVIWSSKPDASLLIWTPKEMWSAYPLHCDPPELQPASPWFYLPEIDCGDEFFSPLS